MGKQVLISSVLVAVVALSAMAFFWQNPFRVGEITIAMPNGSSTTIKVANSNEISELIRKGLENEHSANALTNSLLSIIEHLPNGSTLGEKLVDLAERRRPPFSSTSVPVKLVYDPHVPQGLAAVCEGSGFLAKNIVVSVLNNDGELLNTLHAYVDGRLAFPCLSDGEILRISAQEVGGFNSHKVLAKRTL